MNALQAILVSLIYGFTEFSSLSGSGHLVLLQSLLKLNDYEGFSAFAVFVRLGAFLAVLFVFWKDIKGIFLDVPSVFKANAKSKPSPYQKLLFLLLVMCLPLAASLFLYEFVQSVFSTSAFIGIALIATGVMIIFANHANRGRKLAVDTSYINALTIGVFQVLALFPGVSRVATSIFACTMSGVNRRFAIKISMLMTIFTIPVVCLMNLPQIGLSFKALTLSPIVCVLSVFVSFAMSVLAIKMLESLLAKGKYIFLALYCFVVGIITTAIYLL